MKIIYKISCWVFFWSLSEFGLVLRVQINLLVYWNIFWNYFDYCLTPKVLNWSDSYFQIRMFFCCHKVNWRSLGYWLLSQKDNWKVLLGIFPNFLTFDRLIDWFINQANCQEPRITDNKKSGCRWHLTLVNFPAGCKTTFLRIQLIAADSKLFLSPWTLFF